MGVRRNEDFSMILTEDHNLYNDANRASDSVITAAEVAPKCRGRSLVMEKKETR